MENKGNEMTSMISRSVVGEVDGMEEDGVRVRDER
jgi:hypothetical protein